VEAASDDVGSATAAEHGHATEPERWRLLFDELAAGRVAALGPLYDLAARRLFGLALWHTGSVEDAGEVVQQAFVRLAEQRRKLATVRNPRAWLLTVTHRLAIDAVRRRRRRRADPIREHPYLEAPADDPDRMLDAEVASRALAALPAAQRDAVYLHHFEACTFAEVGHITGVPTFTAASRYRLGIARLRRILGGEHV
jgi:RNA polymerase sigma-70 factor (ECF subfamily)